MAGFSSMNEGDLFYGPQRNASNMGNSFYETDYSGQFQSQHLSYDQTGVAQYPSIYDPNGYLNEAQNAGDPTEENEPPLLEELDIYPERIVEKVLAVLNPFHKQVVLEDAEYLCKESDLAGPIFFYLLLAMSLFLSGSKAHFGYIYGITVISCLFMYVLLTLMSINPGDFSVSIVASILGYSLIPVIALSLIGIFFGLRGPIGLLLATMSVLWSSVSASRLFVVLSGDKRQQLLIAYPCALISGVYALLILF